jgi:hypothetical protein
MFIVVTGQQHRMREVPAYLYEGQRVVQQPEENYFKSYTLIVDTGSEDRYRAEYVKDRLSSGMFGTVLFETLAEAQQFVEEGKKL